MKLVLKSNDSIHSCKACIHYEYCKQDEDVLLNVGKKDKWWVQQGWVPIPENCPIPNNPNNLSIPEKVIFT